uniref:ZP domain-containing protein n=1 Tax=Brugia pahangi TaxID=6280 RepID=A0A0N4TPB9_BRUPA
MEIRDVETLSLPGIELSHRFYLLFTFLGSSSTRTCRMVVTCDKPCYPGRITGFARCERG